MSTRRQPSAAAPDNDSGADDIAMRIEAMYREEFSRCVRVARAVSGDHDGAVDVVQDAFAHALRSTDRYSERGSLRSWVWAIIVNQARNHRRSNVRRMMRTAELSEDISAPASDPAEVMAAREAIRRLPERQRLIVFLRHYGGLSYSEIAQVVAAAPGTVGSSLSQAHAALKRQLEGEGTP